MGANIVEKQRHLGFVWEFTLGKSLVFSPQRNLGTITFGVQLTTTFSFLRDKLFEKYYSFQVFAVDYDLKKNK